MSVQFLTIPLYVGAVPDDSAIQEEVATSFYYVGVAPAGFHIYVSQIGVLQLLTVQTGTVRWSV